MFKILFNYVATSLRCPEISIESRMVIFILMQLHELIGMKSFFVS